MVVESVEESVYMATPYDPAETVVLPCSSVANPPKSDAGHLVGQMTTTSNAPASEEGTVSGLLCFKNWMFFKSYAIGINKSWEDEYDKLWKIWLEEWPPWTYYAINLVHF